MHHQLRLAEREGLLTGRYLSEVQHRAVQILLYLDDVKDFEDEFERFKYALAVRPDYDPEKMFPQYFPDQVVDDDSQAGDEAGYDYEAVEWQGPSDADQETLNKMLAMLKNASGSVSGDVTFGGGDAGKWV